MIIDPSQISSSEAYSLMVGTVVPRPIAWVTSLSPEGVVNLAPFSYFQAIGSRPPMVSISIGQRKWNGSYVKKDTLRNIEASGEFVINIASLANLDPVNQSSAALAPEASEVEELGLATVASDLVAPPRIADSPVHFECKLDRVVMLGREPQMSLVIGEIVRFHVADEVWDPDTRTVDPEKLQPIARLGGPLYASLGDIVARKRPE